MLTYGFLHPEKGAPPVGWKRQTGRNSSSAYTFSTPSLSALNTIKASALSG